MKNLVSHKEAVNRSNAIPVVDDREVIMHLVVDGKIQKVKVDPRKENEGLLFTDFSADSLLKAGALDLLQGNVQYSSDALNVVDAIGSADSAIEAAGLYKTNEDKKNDEYDEGDDDI